MLHVKFDTGKVLEQIEKSVANYTDVDIDAAVTAALDEIADVMLEQMQEGVRRHYKKGRAYRAIERSEVQRAGNYLWVEVGALRIRAEHKDGFHVIYQEYGSPTLPADPWLRPVIENKAQVKRIILETFEKWSVPNVKAA